jgi:eukaryotic-like serine/threonine-protein kinase
MVVQRSRNLGAPNLRATVSDVQGAVAQLNNRIPQGAPCPRPTIGQLVHVCGRRDNLPQANHQWLIGCDCSLILFHRRILSPSRRSPEEGNREPRGTVANVEDLVGIEVQGWLLTSVIGRGSDGIVYAGHKNGLDAAIKLFYPEPLAKNITSARERLELQLALIGEKHHPNLVRIYGGGEDTELGTLFLVMELVRGVSLDKLIGQIPPEAIIPLAGQLVAVARFLETKELVHRDIKPANIVISDDFQLLTLLDLGIVHQLPADDDCGRLSGTEFVATLRYSPPEFVWREEQEDVDGAWQAVTFYQIGATLHDMIMKKPLFAGHDTPRAHLYDSVRDRTPQVESSEVAGWLIQTVQACLVKDWRQRLQLVSWDAFSEPASESKSAADTQQREMKIRLLQVRKEEKRRAAAKQTSSKPCPTREQRLWELNNALILEIRTYLLDASIFPKCSIVEMATTQREYATHLRFERDFSRDFTSDIVFIVTVAVDTTIEDASKLSFTAEVDGKIVAAAAWTEMFTVETAFAACRQSFLSAVESLLTE